MDGVRTAEGATGEMAWAPSRRSSVGRVPMAVHRCAGWRENTQQGKPCSACIALARVSASSMREEGGCRHRFRGGHHLDRQPGAVGAKRPDGMWFSPTP